MDLFVQHTKMNEIMKQIIGILGGLILAISSFGVVEVPAQEPILGGFRPISVPGGGTGFSSTSPYSVIVSGQYGTSTLSASSSPSFGRLIATSTSATSTIQYGLKIVSGGLTSSTLTSCDTIDTDASGNLTCGSDATGAGGSGTFSWTPTTNFGNLANSTSTQLWLRGSPISLSASSTSVFDYASTTAFTVTGNAYFPGSGIWNSSGNLGIGTTSPWGLLSVNPNGVSGPSFAIGSSTKTDFVVTNGGNVGIGIANPATFLHVKSATTTSNSTLILETGIDQASEYNDIDFRVTAGDTYGIIRNIINAGGEGSMAFLGRTSGVMTEVMRFEGSGDMMVGITNGIGKLNIARGGGTGANAPTTLTAANNYLSLGSAEYNNSSYRIIGFGYQPTTNTNSPAYIGYQEMAAVSGNTKGDLIFGTRDVTTDTQASERLRIMDSGEIGIGTSSPSQLLSVHGNTLISGNITGVSGITATGTIDFSGATVLQKTYRTFTYATTSWTGTTTILLGTAIVKETWNQAVCRTDVGTLNVQFYNSGNLMNMLSASTASSTAALSTNNALPALTNRKVDVGTPATSPKVITCTVDATTNL